MNDQVIEDSWRKRFRLVAWLEGGSFVILVGIAMPLKYLAGMPMAVRVVGMAHGILFILYSLAVVDARLHRNWDLRRTFWGFVAGLLPFGTFVFESRLPRSEH